MKKNKISLALGLSESENELLESNNLIKNKFEQQKDKLLLLFLLF